MASIPTTRQTNRPTADASREAAQRKRKSFQPPLTPMIDVTFLLLVFFILTSTFRQMEGQLPGAITSPRALHAAVWAGFNTISFPARSTEVRPDEATEPSMQDGRNS